MPKGRQLILVGVLEEHFEELQFLWSQRHLALRSPDYTPRAIAHLDSRIEAHVRGLLVGVDHIAALIDPALKGDDPLAVFAAAYSVLRTNTKAAVNLVWKNFTEAKDPRLAGICEALCHWPIAPLRQQLLETADSAGPEHAVAAAQIMAFHSDLELTTARFDKLRRSDKPAVRLAAWRVAAMTATQHPAGYEEGVSDPDKNVRREALLAALWAKHQPALDYCRRLAFDPIPDHFDAILYLGILGKPHDLNMLVHAAGNAALGPRRFAPLGAFGHPAVVETLIQEMRKDDPASAAAAGAAFTQITGCDVASDQKVAVSPGDGKATSDLEKEFLDEVKLPDPEKATEFWRGTQQKFLSGTRWCWGLEVSSGATHEMLAGLNLESRWQACLRGRFEGTWHGIPADLERFPQIAGS